MEVLRSAMLLVLVILSFPTKLKSIAAIGRRNGGSLRTRFSTLIEWLKSTRALPFSHHGSEVASQIVAALGMNKIERTSFGQHTLVVMLFCSRTVDVPR